MHSIYVLFAVCCSALLCAAPPPAALPYGEGHALIARQIEQMDLLVQATEQSLADEKKVRALILEYQKIEAQFIKHPEDNAVLLKMVRQAAKILDAVKQAYLEHLFDPEFLEELNILARAAAKRSGQ
jgi:hypothetical protein